MPHRIATTAEADLDEIWFYVAVQSSSTEIADRLIDSITDRFLLISRFPEIGRTRDHDIRPGIRSFSVGEYVILYRIAGSDVLILHIMHGSRDIASLLL